MNWRKSWRGFDWWLTVSVFLLTIFGLVALYSLSLGRTDEQFNEFKKQVLFFGVGVVLMTILSRANYIIFRLSSRTIYLLTLALAVGVLFFGSTVRGTRGWYVIAGTSFQPVELLKIGVILILATLASLEARSFKTSGFFLRSAALAALPAALVMAQPDFGSALLLLAIWAVVAIMAGVRWRYWLYLILVAAGIFCVAWFGLFRDYQKERLLTFVDPGRDPLGRGYNVTQAVVAIGSGNLLGRGVGYGSQSQLRFLPETQTDFIFAVVAEELGLVGVVLVLALYGLLFWRLLLLASSSRDDFSLFLAIGTTGLFFIQFFINVGMNLGLLPVTGITLPFLSAGGSSLIANYLLIGMVQASARARQVGVV